MDKSLLCLFYFLDNFLRDYVNAALMDMWEKGEYQKIYEKWFGKDTKDYLPLTWKMELWP